jgi:hypothetical protein
MRNEPISRGGNTTLPVGKGDVDTVFHEVRKAEQVNREQLGADASLLQPVHRYLFLRTPASAILGRENATTSSCHTRRKEGCIKGTRWSEELEHPAFPWVLFSLDTKFHTQTYDHQYEHCASDWQDHTIRLECLRSRHHCSILYDGRNVI